MHGEALRVARAEPLLSDYLHMIVGRWSHPREALAAVLSQRLADPCLSRDRLSDLVAEAIADDPSILGDAMADLEAIVTRDPAAGGALTPFLHYKGYHALQWHRVAHWLWKQQRQALAFAIQGHVSQVLSVDIHPAARFGRRVFIDHGTGVVAGETAVVGNDVSILQSVTLGGTGKEKGDRHPKVQDGVLIGAGAKVLGNITIGRGAKIGAGSVVLKDVPACATVAGVPARIVGWCGDAVPALAMDHRLPEGAEKAAEAD
ncbi:serine O-acetyltransferase [Acetobacteraceae bacterium H6797]|nr:serine O-acetyltransferase [Acetobacteraceae bacterium H6797]